MDKIRIGVIARRTTIATLLTFYLRLIDPLKYPLANATDQFLGNLVKLKLDVFYETDTIDNRAVIFLLVIIARLVSF